MSIFTFILYKKYINLNTKNEEGCWCGCLSGARYRQLYDLHINCMTYKLFFIPDYQFQKVFLCFLR